MAVTTTPQQDRDFLELLVKEIDINDASFVLEWVAGQFAPEEVYDEWSLKHWAETNGYVLEEQ